MWCFAFWNVPQMRRYHDKGLASEWCSYNARRISSRWAVLRRTAHWRDNSLAEVDAPLSRQAKSKKKKHHGTVLDVQPVVLYGWDVPQIAAYLKIT